MGIVVKLSIILFIVTIFMCVIDVCFIVRRGIEFSLARSYFGNISECKREFRCSAEILETGQKFYNIPSVYCATHGTGYSKIDVYEVEEISVLRFKFPKIIGLNECTVLANGQETRCYLCENGTTAIQKENERRVIYQHKIYATVFEFWKDKLLERKRK